MLYRALELSGGKTPIIQKFCKLASRGTDLHHSSEKMDLVTQACGVEPVTDYLMQETLRQIKEESAKVQETSAATKE